MSLFKFINKVKVELGYRFNKLSWNLFDRSLFASIGEASIMAKGRSILNHQYIHIGNNFSTLERFRIEAIDKFNGQVFMPKIIIGNNVTFNTDVHIGCIDQIEIGDNVLGASRIFITDHSHGATDTASLALPPNKRLLVSKGPVIIKKNVWIGEGVVILSGVTIGENCIIGANAVVTKSFPANTIIAGNPAVVIKTN